MLLMHCKIYWKIENESAYIQHQQDNMSGKWEQSGATEHTK